MYRYAGLLLRNLSFVSVTRNVKLPMKETLFKRLCQYSGHNVDKPRTAVSATRKFKPGRVQNIEALFRYINEGKQFYLKLLTNVLSTVNYDELNNDQTILLLKCCGRLVPDSPKHKRNEICQNIYSKLNKSNLNLEVYHAYINVCTDNDVLINAKEFIKSLQCLPDKETYKQLLKNCSTKGHIQQAYEILDLMKTQQIPADEEVFNALLTAHVLEEGMKAAENVLDTMNSAHIAETINTNFAILRALTIRGDVNEFKKALVDYPVHLENDKFMEMLEIIGLKGLQSWLPLIIPLRKETTCSKEYSKMLEELCIHLIHMKQSDVAINFYFQLTPFTSQLNHTHNYAFFLLKEMLECNIAYETIIKYAEKLRDENWNTNIFENLTEVALRHKHIEPCWNFLNRLPYLRPHFFWPLFIDSHQTEGELGLFKTFERVHSMNVKLNFETFQDYIFPSCELSVDNIPILLMNLQKSGYTVKELLTPLLINLLRSHKVKLAANISKMYNVEIFGDKLLKELGFAWTATKDSESIVFLLRKICATSPHLDFAGEFLFATIRNCKTNEEFQKYTNLLRIVKDNNLKICSSNYEKIIRRGENSKLHNDIQELVNPLLDFDKNAYAYIPHPKNMSLDELECHFIQLKEGDMNYRGVLRKLIQKHCNAGNMKRVKELRQQFSDLGCTETVGMKASIMHAYVQVGKIEEALELYNDLKVNNTNLVLDTFKIIDLAALFIKNNRFTEATELLTNYYRTNKILHNPLTDRNCRNLLISFKNTDEQSKMFQLLLTHGFCKPTNAILGTLVKLHLNNNNIEAAVETFVKLSSTYKCTPLKLELLNAVVGSKNEKQLNMVLGCISNIHNSYEAEKSLVFALSENGFDNALKKTLMLKPIISRDLKNQCQRWIKEDKLVPLQTLASVARKLPYGVIDTYIIYSAILQFYGMHNDCESALRFYEYIKENDEHLPNKDIEKELNNLLVRCNYNQCKKV